jgi:DNA-binding protein Fis
MATSSYFVGIGAWERMTIGLLFAVVDRCDGDLAHAAETTGMSEATMRRAVADARAADLPKFYAVVRIEVEPDSWKRMLARMLLAVIDEASSLASAAAVLGLRKSALRGRVRRARWLLRGTSRGSASTATCVATSAGIADCRSTNDNTARGRELGEG